MSSYGDEGKAYIEWCANMAQSLHIGVPWLMCQQSDAPEPMVLFFFFLNLLIIFFFYLIPVIDFCSQINTCNGWYCDQFTPNRPTSPKMWTENWTGW